MSNKRHHHLAELAAAQHGVFTRQQARDIGFPDSTLTDSVAAGRYRSVARGIFVVSGSKATHQQAMMVAVQSMNSLAAVSHRSAAQMWQLMKRGTRNIEVVTTRWDRVDRAGVTVHESLDLGDDDVSYLDGIPVTTPARTVVDLGAVSPWAVEAALEAGIRRGLLEQSEVELLVDRVGRKGRRGVGVIRPLLAARRKWDVVTESALEDLFRKAVDEMQLPQPVPQFVLRDLGGGFVCRSDFAYVDERILIELDSEAHHMDRMTFRRDPYKQNEAVSLGWTVLRFTWWDLQQDLYQVGAHVAAALQQAHRLPTPLFQRR